MPGDEITADVIPSIAGFTWEQMQPHVASVSIGSQRIRLLDMPGLLKSKQGTRPKDQMDAAVLRAALERLGKA